jgi:hypothetical protein
MRRCAPFTLETAGLIAAVAGVFACASHPAATASSSEGSGAGGVARATTPAGPHAEGLHYSVDAAQVGACAADAECSIAIHVTARDDYHVNVDYPHKFTAMPSEGIELLGKDAAKRNVFSKPAGDFTLDGPKAGTLAVRFKAKGGTPTVRGTLKIGVCSDETCMIPEVELAVPVTVK